MEHVAPRQAAESLALEGACFGAAAGLAAFAASVSAPVGIRAALVLLPILIVLRGILLPEGNRCGPPGN